MSEAKLSVPMPVPEPDEGARARGRLTVDTWAEGYDRLRRALEQRAALAAAIERADADARASGGAPRAARRELAELDSRVDALRAEVDGMVRSFLRAAQSDRRGAATAGRRLRERERWRLAEASPARPGTPPDKRGHAPRPTARALAR